MDLTKPYKSIWFGNIHGPKLFKFIRFRWAFISLTPVVLLPYSRDTTLLAGSTALGIQHRLHALSVIVAILGSAGVDQ